MATKHGLLYRFMVEPLVLSRHYKLVTLLLASLLPRWCTVHAATSRHAGAGELPVRAARGGAGAAARRRGGGVLLRGDDDEVRAAAAAAGGAGSGRVRGEAGAVPAELPVHDGGGVRRRAGRRRRRRRRAARARGAAGAGGGGEGGVAARGAARWWVGGGVGVARAWPRVGWWWRPPSPRARLGCFGGGGGGHGRSKLHYLHHFA